MPKHRRVLLPARCLLSAGLLTTAAQAKSGSFKRLQAERASAWSSRQRRAAKMLVRLRDRSGDEFVAEPFTLTKTMGGQDITVDVYKGGPSRHCSASPT